MLLLLPAAAPAAPSAAGQIDQAVSSYLTTLGTAEASRQGWHGMRVSHDSKLLGSSEQLPACDQPVQVSGDDKPLLSRQRLTVSCADHPGWSLVVVSQPSLHLPAVFASQTIERGQTIEAGQLLLREVEIDKASRGFYNRIEQVVGMGAKRRIRAEQMLSPNLLAASLLVRRGDQVRILASHEAISASTMGEAQENGGLGEVIRVKNLGSGKTIDAKVLKVGVVTSTFR